MTADRSAPAIEIAGLSKRYGTDDSGTLALTDVNVTVGPHEFVTVIGPGTQRSAPIWVDDVAAVLAASVDHPQAAGRTFELGGPDRVTWNELYTHEYVSVDKTSGNRLLLDQALSAVAPRAPSVCETRHVTTMLGLVEAGLGVAAVPSMAMPGRDHPILTSVPLVEPVVNRRVGIVKRRGRALTVAHGCLSTRIRLMRCDGFAGRRLSSAQLRLAFQGNSGEHEGV